MIKTLNSLQYNRTPGEDGFAPEFYKELKDVLIPPIVDIRNLSAKRLTLPESFTTAIISIIHKKNKDLLKCASYRPISVPSTDYKLILKLLAK